MPKADPNIADVVATVKKFHKVGGNESFSDADILLQPGGPSTVTQPDGVNGPIQVLVAEGSTVQIRFSLVDGTGGKTPLTFVPVGIGFKFTNGSNEDPNGLTTFPSRQVSTTDDETVLLIDDVVTATTSFEFGLVIQQVENMALSIIDPMLTNQTN